jgi:hypothetical protein
VGKDQKDKQFVYIGPLKAKTINVSGKPVAPPSMELARRVAVDVLGGFRGRYHSTAHCRERMSRRHFDVFDIRYAIKNGRCVGGSEYSLKHDNHKFRFRGDVDGIEFEAVFAVSARHDYVEDPLIVLITGIWKTKTGIRKRR